MRRPLWLIGGAALVGLVVLLPFLVAPFYLNIAREILILALFALSIDILLGFGGLATLGQAGISGAASYVVAILAVSHGVNPGLAALAGIAGATILAFVFGILNARTHGTYFLLITLAEGMIIWGLVIRWTPVTGGLNGIPGIVRPQWLQTDWAYYWFVLVVLIVMLLGVRHLMRSPFGLTLRGVRESESRMRALGYNVTKHRLAAFVVSGAVAGLAGVLLVFEKGFISPPATHLARSAEGLLMVLVGGPATLIGVVVGAGFVTLTRNVVSIWTDRWQLIMGIGFVLVVLFARHGLVPAIRRGFTWVQRRWGNGFGPAGTGAGPNGAEGKPIEDLVS